MGPDRPRQRAKGWDLGTIRSCIVALQPGAFHKSQECAGNPDVWLDIYRPQWAGERWYVKFVREDDGGGYRVLSFCRDGEQH